MNMWMKRLSVLVVLCTCFSWAVRADLEQDLSNYITEVGKVSQQAIDKVKDLKTKLEVAQASHAEQLAAETKKLSDELATTKSEAEASLKEATAKLQVEVDTCKQTHGEVSEKLTSMIAEAKKALEEAAKAIDVKVEFAPVTHSTPAAAPVKPAAAEPTSPAPVTPTAPVAAKVTPIGTTSIKKAIDAKSTMDDKRDEATKQANLLQNRIEKNEFTGAKLARATQTVIDLKDFAAKRITWSVLSTNLMKPDKKP